MEEQYSKPLTVFFSGSEKCLPGHFFGPAIRAHYLMHIVLEGKGTYEVRGQRYELKKGDVFLIYPREMTIYKADDEEPWEYAWVAFDGYEAKKILNQTGFQGKKLVYRPFLTQLLLNRVGILVGLFASHEYNDFELTGQFYQVMALMVKGKLDNKESPEKQYFQKAFEYIYHNYGYPLKISELAKHVGIDRTYLYKIFMEIEECSPKQFLLQFRIQAAKNMLGTMDYSVTETAYSCGFKDAAAFCNHFKKLTGMTPKQYQRSLKDNF